MKDKNKILEKVLTFSEVLEIIADRRKELYKAVSDGIMEQNTRELKLAELYIIQKQIEATKK